MCPNPRVWTRCHAVRDCLDADVVGFLWLSRAGSRCFLHLFVSICISVRAHVFLGIKVPCQSYFAVCVGDAVHPAHVATATAPWSSSRQPHTHSHDRRLGSAALPPLYCNVGCAWFLEGSLCVSRVFTFLALHVHRKTWSFCAPAVWMSKAQVVQCSVGFPLQTLLGDSIHTLLCSDREHWSDFQSQSLSFMLRLACVAAALLSLTRTSRQRALLEIKAHHLLLYVQPTAVHVAPHTDGIPHATTAALPRSIASWNQKQHVQLWSWLRTHRVWF